jgi:putative ABC transport system permease protein
MGLIYRLSLRNLFRQKRRNILLGVGISFGMMILVIANSFSHGMVDVLIKDIVSNAFGHLVIQGNPSHQIQIIRDRQRIDKIINTTIKKEDIAEINENLGMFGRAIGNGEADNVVVVGVAPHSETDKKQFFTNFFTLVKGNFDEFYSKDIEYPVIISQEKAKSLNVKVHDIVRVRLPMVTGQIQAAPLTVVAIANSNNTFMNIVLFMEADRVKKLLGYKPWESASLQINLKNPEQTAKYYADILQQKLKPGILAINGKVGTEDCSIYAFNNDDQSKKLVQNNIKIISGNIQEVLGKKAVLVSSTMARKLNLQVGKEFVYDYQTKFEGDHQETFKVEGIYQTNLNIGVNTILMNGERIFDIYNHYLPQSKNTEGITKESPIYPALAYEWKLLPRSKDSEDLMKKYKQDRKIKTDQMKFDVVTMYEGASDILKLESVLNLITIIAVLVLFFIILIGVINTLRMTIRERTREIGTVRAIGMQKNDVRNTFIMETLLLTAFSCIAGIILGIIVMQILGVIQFNVDNALSMILKNKHLYFKMDPLSILGNFALIMAISGVTAYFPARRAAKMSAVEALRHYE